MRYEDTLRQAAPSKIRVAPSEALAIVKPYVWGRLREQLVSVLPIVFYLFLFQLLILHKSVADALTVSCGIVCVIVGLMFFIEGLKLGLMPFGEVIGSTLPQKATLGLMLGFAFLLGLGATFAEPAIGALREAGRNIDPARAPLLYGLLTRWSLPLVFAVGAGVGVATIIGVLRFLFNWRLGILIIPSLILLMALTLWAHLDPQLATAIGLAWDCGGVTTGPVTVPLVLSLGIGVCSVTGKRDTGMAGFGIVTLASLFPIIAVLLLAFVVYYSGLTASIDLAGAAAAAPGASWLDRPLPQAVVLSVRAIVPLCIFLFVVQRYLLKEPIRRVRDITTGIGFALIGMILFNLGLSIGLSPLGAQVGQTIPAAFHPPETSLYGDTFGKIVTILFAFVLGYGATLAEPALNALGYKVEEITNGAFKKKLLMHSVCAGVSLGLAVGVAKIIFSIPLTYLLIPPYLLLIPLTLVSKEKFVNIAWDSAGVTTGPITVPLVIAVGLGVGQTLNVLEGFGMISMASVGPILTVLTMGLLFGRRA